MVGEIGEAAVEGVGALLIAANEGIGGIGIKVDSKTPLQAIELEGGAT